MIHIDLLIICDKVTESYSICTKIAMILNIVGVSEII